MRLLVLHGVADGFVVWVMENYRKSYIRNNRVKKYQASQVPSSKEPHLAREPYVPDPWFMM